MLGTKLLLLSFVVYVSGQSVSYDGRSNVRTQGRLPPRPLRPNRPVYNPQPYQPLPEQPAVVAQPVYQPPRPEQPPSNPQPMQPTHPVYQPPRSEQPPSNPQPIQPTQPVYQPPRSEQPPSNPQPIQPVYQPPQPVYQPRQPVYERPTEPPALDIPLQPIPRPIDGYPRPLPPLTWKPVETTEAPVEIITPEVPTTIEVVNPEPSNASLSSHDPRAVDTETPAESENNPEKPTVVLQPETTPISLSTPEDPITEVENDQPKPAPVTTPETPLSNTIADPEQPTLPVTFLVPRPEPIYNPGYPTPRPISRPLPTSGPVLEPTYQTEAPVESAPTRPGLPPIQPILPPRPNYRPIPTAPAPTKPPAPVNTVDPNTQRPLPTPPRPRTTYEPLQPPTPYPTPVSSLAPVPTQPPAQPTSYPMVPPTSNGPAPGLPDISLVIPMTNFECRNGNGYYKIVNECDTYIKCEYRQAYKYSCPDGLHFNPEAQYPEYPCAYPSQVQCDSTASRQIPRPTNECPNRYGFFPISGGDCSKYIMCQEGKATVMSCPFGLVFNDRLSSCDWPENVPQCNAKAFNDFKCPAAPEDDPDQLTKYRYGSDCRMYLACQHGHPRLLKCDPGMSFDMNSQVCMDSDLVAECRITNQH